MSRNCFIKGREIISALLVVLCSTLAASAQSPDLFVCGYYSNNILKISGANQAVTEFVPAGSQGLQYPDGIDFGPDGNLYVSSQQSNQVLRFSSQDGHAMGVFASSVGGGTGLTLDLVWGPDGDLYVLHATPSGIGSIERYMPDGTHIDSFLYGAFANPRGIAFGPAGDIYISADNSAVHHYLGTTGTYLGDVIGVPAAHKIAFGSEGDIYVCGYAWPPQNPGCVEKYNGRTYAWEAEITAPSVGAMYGAVGLAFDPSGNFYVGSVGTSTVHMFDSSGNHQATISAPTIMAGSDELVFRPTPPSQTVIPTNELIVGTQFNNAVLSFDATTGKFNRALARSGQDNVEPVGITIGPLNDVYLSSADGRILRYDHATGASSLFASNVNAGDICYSNGRFYLLYQDPVNAGHLDVLDTTGAFLYEAAIGSINTPRGISADSNGIIYISCLDANGGAIMRYYPLSNTYDRLASLGGTYPHNCIYYNGIVYATVFSAGMVVRVDAVTGAIIPAPAVPTPQRSIYASPHAGGVGNAHSLAFAPNGNLVVSSYYENELIAFDAATGLAIGSFTSDHFNGLQWPGYFLFRANQTDVTPPNLIIMPGDGNWRTADVSVTITAMDEPGGSGLQNIVYSTTGDQISAPTTSTISPIAFTVNKEGVTTVIATATDNAGNYNNANAIIKLDKTPPHTTAVMTASGSNVLVTLSASDTSPTTTNVSGVAQTYYSLGSLPAQVYTAPLTVPSGATIAFWSIDVAGNVEPTNTAVALIPVTVSLADSHGNPLSGGTAQYYSGSWQTIGVTSANGTVTVGLAPNTYSFAISYKGARIQVNQDIRINQTVAFKTTSVTVKVQDSLGNPLPAASAQFYAMSWQNAGTTGANGTTSIELLPTTYAFAVTYLGGRVQKNQDVSSNPLVVFQTTHTTIKLVDSAGNPIAGGDVQYYAGAWIDLGNTGSDGTVSCELEPNTYAFSITYLGGRVQKNQNITASSLVLFQTSRATIKLVDSFGDPLAGGRVQYYASGWRDVGLTGSDGTVSIELLPNSYSFSMDFRGGRVALNQDISTISQVLFQTTRVHSGTNTCVQYYGGGWLSFTNDMELLPTAYVFRFSDGMANTSYSISGTAFNIH